MLRSLPALLVFALLFWAQSACAQVPIEVIDPEFDSGATLIQGVLDLNILDPSPGALSERLGLSPWFVKLNASALANLGFRPGASLNSALNPGVATLSYNLGLVGSLLGAEMPEADLWQPLAGTSLQTNTTYTLSLELNAGLLLDASALAARGFGIGITTSASSFGFGSFYWDSLSSPSSLTISPLTATVERLTLSFTTGASVPTGDIGIVIFAGRGNQGLQNALLTTFRIDHVGLSSVPEPSGVCLAMVGGLSLMCWVRLRKR